MPGLTVLLFQVLQAWRIEQSTRPRTLGRARRDDAPQQHDGHAQDRAEHLEEPARHLDAKRHGAKRIHAQREGKAPPAHIEGKRACEVDSGQRKHQPTQPKPPHDERDKDAHDVRDVAGHREVVEELDAREQLARHPAEVHDGVAAHPERAEREERRDHDFARREFVQGQALVVDDQDGHGEGGRHTPHHVGSDERAEGVVWVCED